MAKNSFLAEVTFKYDSKSISKVFRTFFANMAKTFLPLPNKYSIESVNKFYKDLDMTTKFQIKLTTVDIVLNLIKNIEISKAAGIDNLLGRLLELSKSVTFP